MGRYTRGALWFILGTTVLAVGATATSAWLAPDGTLRDLGTGLLLAALAAISHLYPVKSARQGVIYVVANAFLFAGVMLLPPWELLPLCLLALLPVTIRGAARPGAWVRFTFNVAQSTLACQAAGLVLHAAQVHALSRLPDVIWVFLALVLFVAVQLGAVAGIVALNTRTHLLKTGVFTFEALLADLITPFLGAVMAALWYDHPEILILSVLPIGLTYRLMRQVQLVTQADLDPKTGLYNFRYFQEAAQEELRRSGGLRRPVAFFFCDLDYLRDVNNNYGHLAGDKVLEQLSAVLLRCLRPAGTVSRFGGEEFVAMLPGVDPEEACRMAERLRLAVFGQEFDIGTGTPIHVSMCIGISCAPTDGTNLTILTERADKALYAAKAAGRNRVCVWNAALEASQPAAYYDRHLVTAAAEAAPPTAAPASRPAPGPDARLTVRLSFRKAAAIVGTVAVAGFLGYAARGLPGLGMVALVSLAAGIGVRIAAVEYTRALQAASLRQTELEEQHQADRRMLDQWVNTMALLIDAREDDVPGHAEKVATYAVALARELGVPDNSIVELRLAALLHDVGKLGVPEQILNKPASLSPDEWRIMQDHAALGEQVLNRIPGLSRVAAIVGEHHEWYNGQGYPYGRSGAHLTLGSRILAVADAMDTMLSGRPYAAPRTPDQALAELRACAGQQFDPMVVEALGRLIEREGARFLTAAPSVAETA